jgi:ATP/maltotriose-dependent transcriptional regulator MalT
MRTIASGDWVAAAAHAAVRLGPEAALLLRDALAETPHHPAWSRAALASINGTLAAARGDHRTAAAYHLDAADRYAAIGSATDRSFALTAAAAELSRAGDPRAEETLREAAEFAGRNHIRAPSARSARAGPPP